MKLNNNTLIIYLLIPLGCANIFNYIYEFKFVNPKNIEWIWSAIDLSQHYLGWLAFRKEKISFPFGMTTSLTYPYKTSLIFTDSIPIFAFFFKLIDFILPINFQYIGLWGYLSYTLQGVFAGKILNLFFTNKPHIIICSFFFVISPVFIQRMFIHSALASHWILLFSFYIYLNDSFKYKDYCFLWSLNSFLTSLIHVNLLAMNGIILLAFCLKKFLNGVPIKKLLLIIIYFILISLFNVGFILGGFSSKTGSVDYYGLGKYSMNINGFYNSYNKSKILKGFNIIEGQEFEGFCYLGLGCFILLFIVFFIFLVKIKNYSEIKKQKNNWIPLLLIFILSYFLALSPKITFNNKEIITYKIPKFIEKMWSIFRATGRFSWICIYIIYIFNFYMIQKYIINRKIVFLLFIFVFIIQFIDISLLIENQKMILNTIRYKYTEEEDWVKIFENEKIKHIFFGSNNYYGGNWFANSALRYNKTINRFYIAHQNDLVFDRYFNKVVKENKEEYLYILNHVDEQKLLEFSPYIFKFYSLNEWYIIYQNEFKHLKEFYPIQYYFDVPKEYQIIYPNKISYTPVLKLHYGGYTIFIGGENLNHVEIKLMYSRRKNKIFTNILQLKKVIEIVIILKENINDLEIQFINNSKEISNISIIGIKPFLPCFGKLCICKNFEGAIYYYRKKCSINFSV